LNNNIKVLIYDNDQDDSKYILSILYVLNVEITMDRISSYDEGIELFKTHSYDIIFLDYFNDIGKNLIEFILKNNPKQRVITISDIHECATKHGIEFCLNNYNRERILRPLEYIDVIKIFKTNEYIDEKHSSDILLLKLRQIEKTLRLAVSDFEFDIVNLIFMNKEKKLYSSYFFLIIEKLDTYNIQYKVDPVGNIEIIR